MYRNVTTAYVTADETAAPSSLATTTAEASSTESAPAAANTTVAMATTNAAVRHLAVPLSTVAVAAAGLFAVYFV